MATLDHLKEELRQKAERMASSTQPLSDSEYDAGLEILINAKRTTYQDFILPQLSQLLDPLLQARTSISILEIGPGQKSVLGGLPIQQRQKIKKYAAFEPNALFATRLERWLSPDTHTGSPLPCLEDPPEIHHAPFDLNSSTSTGTDIDTNGPADKFDVILFCHSMYGMRPKRDFIGKALGMLGKTPDDGLVAVFHRDGPMEFDGLICHRTASFPTGLIRVDDEDQLLDKLAQFISGLTTHDTNESENVKAEWRLICRKFGHRNAEGSRHLFFYAPEIMVAFTQHSAALMELLAKVPATYDGNMVKNREARYHRPASIVKPRGIRQVQQCVQWALDHGMSLTVIGGSHSGQCIWPNVVAVDMGAFDQVHIIEPEGGMTDGAGSDSLVVVGAGCKAGDIIRKTMAAGLTVPLGARPSVGAGLWLQGGIGHLARLHGLACDAISGAVVISVASGQVLCVGQVPTEHQPLGALRPENESDLLWGLKGAGTNLGIVVSVVFKAYTAPAYSIQNWMLPLEDKSEARLKLGDFDQLVASKLPWHCSADAYLYWEQDKLHLGVSMCAVSMGRSECESLPVARKILGPEASSQTVDSVGLFGTEMYMSGMHGGHASGKTSSFKRCVFLRDIGAAHVAELLIAAIETRPSPNCYLHLLQGGGAVSDAAVSDTAFGCRDWDFACIITGVWPRDQDGTGIARAAAAWVYNVAKDLLPVCSGIYGADLGPDPRDATLAPKAFGLNLPRLARLKRTYDPSNVLAYACPLPKTPLEPKLIVLVTGEHCAGKDYCAGIWVSVLSQADLKARAASISEATKREYAASTGADLDRLLEDREYKEQHRPALSTFFQDQVKLRPRLPEEHFLNAVYNAGGLDVLFITGMRDEAPVATFSHLVPDSRLIEVNVSTGTRTRQARGGHPDRGGEDVHERDDDKHSQTSKSSNNCPGLTFNNDNPGNEAAISFAKCHLLSFFHEDLRQLADIVRLIPNLPRQGIDFRDVLGISQQVGGLILCASLLRTHFAGDWAEVDAIACCETGAFLFASTLAAQVDVPLALIREAGKLPPPTISVVKSSSYISSSAFNGPKEKRIEIGRDAVSRGATVVIVDDVLATGETTCAVLQLLNEAGVATESVTVMVVAELPVHRGRDFLRQRGYGGARIHSLLVFGGQ